MLTDEGWAYPAINDLKIINQANTWLYEFQIPQARQLTNGIPFWVQAKNGEQNPYTFKSGNRDVDLSNTFNNYIGNFAQYQDPQIIGTSSPAYAFGWRNYNNQKTALVFRSGLRQSDMRKNNREEEVRFWGSVYEFEDNFTVDDDETTTTTDEPIVTTEVPDSSISTSFSISILVGLLYL